MKTGLFFGTYNPIHTGHLIIANYMAQNTDLDQVWMVITPQNPHKAKESLLDEKQRLYMVNITVEKDPKILASNIEFDLPRPSYTIDTLTYLQEKYPKREFVLIMGTDNVQTLKKWKNYEKILSDYSIYVYDRKDYNLGDLHGHPSINLFDVPLLNISASYIRNLIAQGKSVQYMVPQVALDYIEQLHLYK